MASRDVPLGIAKTPIYRLAVALGCLTTATTAADNASDISNATGFECSSARR